MSRLSPLLRALGKRSHFEFEGERRAPIETLTEEGAEILKERIVSYWKARGKTVTPRVELNQFHMSARSRTFVVRSDMKNGRPE